MNQSTTERQIISKDCDQASDGESSFVREYQRYDLMLGPLGRRAIDAAQVPEGGVVIDVGCGAGSSTLEVAARVGRAGRAIGIDTDATAIHVARCRATEARLSQAEFWAENVETLEYGARRADAMISRFGTLHFSKPEQTYLRLASMLKPGSPFAFVCSRAASLNEWMQVIARALERGLGRRPSIPEASGPFALGEESKIRALMNAGFDGVTVTAIDQPLNFGQTVEDAVRFFDQTDGKKLGLGGQPRLRVLDALTDGLAPYASSEGVLVPAASWLVLGFRRPIRL